MRAFIPLRLTVLGLGLVIISTGIGCRTGLKGGESVWKRPNLSGLAFWKKDDSTVPKPPAVHFDPTPAQSDSQLAKKNSPSDLKTSLDKLAKYEDKVEQPAASGIKSQKSDSSEPVSGKPLRAPYQLSTPLSTPGSLGSGTASTNSKPPAASPNKVSEFVTKAPLSATTPSANPTKDKPATAMSAEQARAKFNSDMQGLKVPTPSGQSQQTAQQAGQQPTTAKPTPSQEQLRLEAEVAKAQREIAELKSQLANNVQKLAPLAGNNSAGMNSSAISNQGFQPAPNAQKAPVANVARLNDETNGASISTKNSAGFAPLRPNASVAEPPTQPVNGTSLNLRLAPMKNQYPVTTQNGFSTANQAALSTSRVDGGVQAVGLQAPLNSGIVDAEEANSNANDVDIPESILKGSGTFSPGSVNRLRGNGN